MARAKVVIDKVGMKELLGDAGIRADIHKRAERVRDRAQATAPVLTGQFAGSGGEQPGGFDVVDSGPRGRARSRIVSRDPIGAIKEARFRTMTRALDAARD